MQRIDSYQFSKLYNFHHAIFSIYCDTKSRFILRVFEIKYYICLNIEFLYLSCIKLQRILIRTSMYSKT
jgi:hypothetical protein